MDRLKEEIAGWRYFRTHEVFERTPSPPDPCGSGEGSGSQLRPRTNLRGYPIGGGDRGKFTVPIKLEGIVDLKHPAVAGASRRA
jgi:hypothetical protein